jgi:hypothetical protein
MMALEKIKNTPDAASGIGSTRTVSQSGTTQRATLIRDDEPRLNPNAGFDPSRAASVSRALAAGQSARAGLTAFRITMLSFVRDVLDLVVETMGAGEDLREIDGLRRGLARVTELADETEACGRDSLAATLGAGLPDSSGHDLTTAAGRESFWQDLEHTFEILQWYEEHIDARLLCLEESSLRIHQEAESEWGVGTQGIDPDKALAMARDAAACMLDPTSGLSGLATSLDNDRVAALLTEV